MSENPSVLSPGIGDSADEETFTNDESNPKRLLSRPFTAPVNPERGRRKFGSIRQAGLGTEEDLLPPPVADEDSLFCSSQPFEEVEFADTDGRWHMEQLAGGRERLFEEDPCGVR